MEIHLQELPGGLILRFGNVQWPARSPDLSHLIISYGDFLREESILPTPQNTAIVTEISLIGQEMLITAMNNLCNCAKMYEQSGGEHLKEMKIIVLFQKVHLDPIFMTKVTKPV